MAVPGEKGSLAIELKALCSANAMKRSLSFDHPWDLSVNENVCSRKLYLRQDETITVDPVWVFGVEGHELVEQDMGNRCHAHRSSGMTGIGFESGIDLCEDQLVSQGFSVYGLGDFRVRQSRS